MERADSKPLHLLLGLTLELRETMELSMATDFCRRFAVFHYVLFYFGCAAIAGFRFCSVELGSWPITVVKE